VLIGDINDSNRSADLQILVSELASRHISRYPITVESINNQEVRFMDTRMGDRGEVAILNRVVDDNKLYYVVSSHLIENSQYSSHSPGYNSRRTGDLSKMRKLLATVVKPLEPTEIIQRSFSVAKEVLEEWKGVAQREMRATNGSFIYGGIDRDTVMQDIIAYSGGAAPFKTGVLAQISTPEFVALYMEYRERMNYKSPRTCVFVNPDGVVYLSGMQENIRQAGGPVVIKNSINDIPQELAGHYAMLKLIEPDRVLQDIGLRAGNCSFWLHEPLLLSAE
jgi:hypothetical protein